MLSRELCKRLQEAGRPQEINPYRWAWMSCYDDPNGDGSLGYWEAPFCDMMFAWTDESGDVNKLGIGMRLECVCPSTDELIEAVRGSSQWVHLYWDVNEWLASAYPHDGKDWCVIKNPDLDTALAELWLKLKESGR